MKKIANTGEFIAELRAIVSYAGTDRPSRQVLAQQLHELSLRVATPYRYLPPGVRDTAPVDPEGSDVAAWAYETEKNGRTTYYAIAYVGKQSKPVLNYSYGTSKTRRDAAIRNLIDSRKERASRQLKQREDKRNFMTELFAGDILYSSWGYDQTNVDFYEVIEVPGNQTVVIREVASKVVKGDGRSESVVPVPGDYIGSPMKKRVGLGERVKINSSSTAYKWDGKPKYQTGPYGGH